MNRQAARRAAALSLTSILIAGSPPASPVAAGTFPGSNGKITFSQCHVTDIFRDGTGHHIRVEASAGGCFAEPAWNASATTLVYRDGTAIKTVNANGTNSKVLYSHDTFAGNPTWSANGNAVAFDGFIGTTEGSRIFVVPAAGGMATVLVELDAQDPAYSPDGTMIAYESHADSSPDIGVMNSDGSEPRNITSGAFGNDGDLDPSWSPDGGSIAFTRADQIWIMNADGSGATQLTTAADASYPAWSPDGAHIAFVMGDDIWVMDRDGSDATNVTAAIHEGERAAPDSPDWRVGSTVHIRSISLNLTHVGSGRRVRLRVTGRVTASDGYRRCEVAAPLLITRNGEGVASLGSDTDGRFRVLLRDRTGRYRAISQVVHLPNGHVCSGPAASPERTHNH